MKVKGKYSALEVAKYILWWNTLNGTPISNLRLQKLLYFVWRDYYRETGVMLWTDSKFEAWAL